MQHTTTKNCFKPSAKFSYISSRGYSGSSSSRTGAEMTRAGIEGAWSFCWNRVNIGWQYCPASLFRDVWEVLDPLEHVELRLRLCCGFIVAVDADESGSEEHEGSFSSPSPGTISHLDQWSGYNAFNDAVALETLDEFTTNPSVSKSCRLSSAKFSCEPHKHTTWGAGTTPHRIYKHCWPVGRKFAGRYGVGSVEHSTATTASIPKGTVTFLFWKDFKVNCPRGDQT